MKYGLFADVGSTFTKVVAVDLENAEIIGRAMSSTTIATDVNIGYDKAANAVMDMCGIKEFDLKLACSSAAGGLKMVAIGLVPELTSQAALLAVQNAGAKVLAFIFNDVNHDRYSYRYHYRRGSYYYNYKYRYKYGYRYADPKDGATKK